MQKRTKTLIGGLIITLVAVSCIAGGLVWLRLPTEQLVGTLYFNDSGEAHGGFEMAAEWHVTLTVRGGVGVLVVTSEPAQIGNDALKKWSYSVTGFQRAAELIIMALDGHSLQLPLIQNDTVWNLYDECYIIRTPELNPTIFPGFLDTYYVELRIESPWIRCVENS